jgi:hypothetical protein
MRTLDNQAFRAVHHRDFFAFKCFVTWVSVACAGASMAAEVTLSNLAQTYNGSPKSVIVTTVPAGLTCTVTYAGSETLPTNAGSYEVVATVVDPVETGSASGTLVIDKATQTINFVTPSAKTYGDAPFELAATSSSGLPVSYTSSVTTVATVSGSTVAIAGAGSTFIRANQPGDLNYLPATQVNRALTVNKKTLSFSLVLPTGKTYGDPPFGVSATVSNGLSIAKWESADPSVATVSPTGLVTIVGAGQTSIIASLSSTESPNYDPAWIAKPLNVARSAAPLPSGTRTVTYSGSAQGLEPGTLPSGQASEITYRDTKVPEAAATPQVVFQNGPDTLALSYPSAGLQATGLWGQAKYVELGGTARKLHSCDVTLATWAGYYGGKDNDPTYRFKEWADAYPASVVLPAPGISIPGNSGGYYHPVTLAFYAYDIVGGTESYRLLTSKTVQAFIPWRPEKLADGVTVYPDYSYAFRVPFDFPEGVILPDQVWVAVSFNTQSYGVAPIGALPNGLNAPYNALNIPSPDGQQAGSTISGTKHFFFKDWRWQQVTQTRGPMLRLRTVPTNATLDAPVNAGTYDVKTQAAAFAADGSSSSILRIGHTYASWRDATFANSGLPPEQITDTADPDGDGLHNFLEYASNFNPLLGDQPSPSELGHGDTLTFTYRRNLHALDLDYSIQGASQFSDSLSWAPVTPLGEVPLSDDGATRVIRATVAKPVGPPCYFLRLKVASP